MRTTDLDQAVAAILADHFGDRRSWFAFAIASDACYAIVAEIDGAVVGTGVATVNGPVAWIGTIWVARSHRRHGLGTALTEAIIAGAEARGSRTLVLVATDHGRRLYEGLGFEVQTWYRTFEAPGLGTSAALVEGRDAAIRPYRAKDLEAIASLDAVATGEDRRAVLSSLATRDGTRILAGEDGELRGFVARAPWGGGATIAPRMADALTILHARRVGYDPDRQIRCGILLENEAGAVALEGDGWTEAWRAPRLIRGDPMTWHPEHLWGQFNHAMG
jgi:ribosomal protein S18 acetylase RimI-like enzyme